MNVQKKKLLETMRTMTPHDIVGWLEKKSVTERAQIINLMTKDDLAEVFRLMSPEAREELLAALSDPDVAALIRSQESDDLVDVLQEMPANLVTKLLRHVPNERRKTINKLLNYPEESVGSLMSVDFVTARETSTKSEIIERIQHSTGGPEHLNEIYIMDDERHLIGRVHISELVKSNNESIKELIDYSVIAVHTHDDQEIASDLFLKYQLLALPVVDSENRLVGILTADDIFEVISDEIHEDYLLLSGVSKTETDEAKKEYLNRSIWSLSRDRIIWLLALMITATLTAYVIQRYEAVLATHVVLAAYIPMLMDSGGNSGTQASTLITRALSIGELTASDLGAVVRREASIGLVTGTILGVVNMARTLLMDDITIQVAFTVSLTLVFVIILAKVVGGILPLFAEKVNQDPAVMAGPMITTIVDTLALILYFQIATFLLGI